MSQVSLEDRVEALEKTTTDIQKKVDALADKSDWLEKVTGSFENDPAFLEVLDYGRQFGKKQSTILQQEHFHAKSQNTRNTCR